MRIITNSEIRSLFLCPKNHDFSYIRGLQPRRRKIYFDEGTASHNAMQVIYKGGTEEEAIAAFDKVYDDHILHLQRFKPDEKEMDKVISKFLGTRALVSVYLSKIVPEDRRRYDTSHVEEEFCVPILDMQGKPLKDVMFAGKLDGIWTEKGEHQASMVVEHKFYSGFDPVENTLYLDQQVTLYALAAAIAFGIRVPITLYNVCRKPRNQKQKDESHEEFFYRLCEIISDPGNRKDYFFRVPVTRGPQHFKVAHEILYNAAMMITQERPMPYIYRNVGDHCLWLCAFRPPCLDEDPRLMEQLYEKKSKLHSELEITEA